MKSRNITEPCLFCNNPAGSKEHLWGAWIHRRRAFGPIRVKVGTAPVTIFDDPERKINTVCQPCNNGWMSGLEQKNIPTIGSMMQDLAIPLNKDQQNLLSLWVIKTAMVLDSVKNLESNPRFYEKSECVDLRVKQSIPARTRIWIARSSVSSLGAYGTDVGINGPDSSKIGTGMVTTIVVGHFAVQTLNTRPLPENTTQSTETILPKQGNWENMLMPIWPIGPDSVMWPPKTTFTASGPRSIAYLMDRWRIGKDVSAK